MMDGDGVLEMCGPAPVAGLDGPAVRHHIYFITALRDHRLDGDAKAVAQLLAFSSASVVGNLRVLVHLAPYTVSYELADDAVALGFAMALDGVADVSDAMSGYSLFDAFVESLLGGSEQTLGLIADFADHEGIAGVAVVTVEEGSAVNRDDVALLEDVFLARYSVYHHIVDGCADAAGERATVVIRETLEGGFCTVIADTCLRDPVYFGSGYARTDDSGYLGQRGRYQLVGRPEQFYLIFCLQIYHGRNSMTES